VVKYIDITLKLVLAYLIASTVKYYYVVFFQFHQQRSERNISEWIDYPYRNFGIMDITSFILASLFWTLIYLKGYLYLRDLYGR